MPDFPGRLRHPSPPVCSPEVSMISGLIRICSVPSVSITTILFSTPTCGAASPTPHASYMVSTISSISCWILGVISSTGLQTFVRTLSPTIRIVLIAIVLLSFFCYVLKNLCVKIKLYIDIGKTAVDLDVPFQPFPKGKQYLRAGCLHIQDKPVQITDLCDALPCRADELDTGLHME